MTARARRDLALFALVCVVLPPLTAHHMPRLFPQSMAIVLSLGVSLAIASVSLNLLLGYAGQISLGHAALLGVGAFAASVVVERGHLPMPLGWLAAILAGGLVALLLGAPALRLKGLYLAIVTMSFGLAMQASVLRWRFFTQGSAGAALPRRLWGDHLLTDESVYLSVCLALLVLVCLLDRNIVASRVGRAFRMLREDEDAASSFGVDVTRYKLVAFVVSGALAGLAGALYGHTIGLVNSDTFNLSLSLRIVLLVVLGGLGRRNPIVVFTVLFGLAPRLPDAVARWQLVIIAGTVLYTAVRLPGGLAELADRFRHRAGSARPDDDEDEDDDDDEGSDDLTLPRLTLAAPRLGATPAPGGLLEVTDMRVSFGALHVLDGVTLTVRPRTIVGVIGPNGAGKSTLFNSISGLLEGATGGVALDGVRLDGLAPHRRAAAGLGRTFQDVGLARDMTLHDSILLAQHIAADYSDLAAVLRTRSVARREQELHVVADEALDRLGFADRADALVGQLSGGQRRLVELAAVLLSAPKVLMLDEPTAGLSPAAAEDLAERLAALRSDSGQTILLIEHNVPLVLDICDYVYVLSDGHVLSEGTPDTVGRNREVLDAYLGGALP
jgi:branched-chain amino acid transport system permease protein